MARIRPYLLVLDFEATCDDGSATTPFDIERQEIIEFPVAVLESDTGEIVSEFSQLVRPTLQPQITPFCTELTSIDDEQLASCPDILSVTRSFIEWSEQQGLKPQNALVVTCGDWDLRTMWPKQLGHDSEIPSPAVFGEWCNIKKIYAQAKQRKAPGMMGMLRQLGLEHVGHHHRGIDDVRNIARIAARLIEMGQPIAATFTREDAQSEHRRWLGKVEQIRRRLRELARQKSALPGNANNAAHNTLDARLQATRLELERTEGRVRAFAGD